jgi:hypothetical protein
MKKDLLRFFKASPFKFFFLCYNISKKILGLYKNGWNFINTFIVSLIIVVADILERRAPVEKIAFGVRSSYSVFFGLFHLLL